MVIVLIVLMGVGALIWLVRIGLVWHFARAVPALPEHPPTDAQEDAPRVTIIVPAKDEADNIGPCVTSLLAQTYPNLRIIVVDDRSEDGTGDIVADLADGGDRLTLVRNADLPAGWTGKCHAIRQGVTHADGDWLLFTDADTVHAPGCVASAVAFACKEGVDLLTLLPAVRAERACERMLQPCLSTTFLSLFPPSLVNRPTHRLAFCNGQFYLIRRALYDRLGGHEAVRREFLEDMALGRKAKASGARVCVASGGDLVAVRMYRGFRALWHGWSRIFFGCGRSGAVLAVWMLLSVLATVLPAAVLAGGAVALALGAGGWRVWAPIGLAALQFALMAPCMARLYRMARCDRRYLPLHPAATAVCVAILANALRLKWFARRITWRGTVYAKQRQSA